MSATYHIVYHVLSDVLSKYFLPEFHNVLLYDAIKNNYMPFLQQIGVTQMCHSVDTVPRGKMCKFCSWERIELEERYKKKIIPEHSFAGQIFRWYAKSKKKK